MRRTHWLPLQLLLLLCLSYLTSAVVGWFLLKHGGFTVRDPTILPGMGFGDYLVSRFFVWDAQWYDVIARVGYIWHPSTTDRQSLAFFPLWGLVLRPVYAVFARHQHIAALPLILAVAYASIEVFFRLGRRLAGERAAVIATALYVFFPAGDFLLQSYPTALMNLITLFVLRDLVDRKEWRPALLAGIGTAAGPLMVALGLTVWLSALWRRRRALEVRALLTLLALGLLALSGLLLFLAWQGIALHDPFAFLMAQKPWDQPRGLGERLWRFVWMTLILPDLYHIVRLMMNFWSYTRTGSYFAAFVRYEFALNFLFMTLMMIGLFWTVSVKPRVVLLYGCLVMVFYVWFHGTTHGGLSTMRLIYICMPGFWGLGRALQSERGMAWGAIGASAAALIVQEVCSDIGQLVL